MTMPKFTPVAIGHFDFNGECHTVDHNPKATICVGGLSRSKRPLYTADQLTEAYEAGKHGAQELEPCQHQPEATGMYEPYDLACKKCGAITAAPKGEA